MTQDDDRQFVDDSERDDANQRIGQRLRKERDAQGLSLEQIAAELRIELRLLKALEEERFADLGAPVFAKGYLKQYGNCLGLDYKELLSQYYDLVEPQDLMIVPSQPIKLHDERQISIWIVAALVFLLLAVVLVVWWYGESNGNPAPVVTSPTSGQVAPVEASGLAGVAEAEPSGEERAAVAGEVVLAETTQSEQITLDVVSPSTFVPDVVAEQADGRVVRIGIAFEEDSWTEIVDARGQRHFYGLGRAGSSSTFSAVIPLAFVLGNADGVTVTLDDEPYSVPQVGRQGNLARFTLDVTEN